MDSMRSNHRCHSKLVRARSTPTFSLMHLLVPGAYRPQKKEERRRSAGLNAPSGAGCLPTRRRWCSIVRSLFCLNAPSGAGCLPTCRCVMKQAGRAGLNAPSGAGCLPTSRRRQPPSSSKVSMHLLVPGAYRRLVGSFAPFRHVSMHLLVPGAYRRSREGVKSHVYRWSQCTFWCRVLTDIWAEFPQQSPPTGLNAPSGAGCLPTARSLDLGASRGRLNAPSGAGCLPTVADPEHVECSGCLNAPSGAGCLPTHKGMFQMAHTIQGLNAPSGAGCLPTLTFTDRDFSAAWSQCTFWCRVLTDMRKETLRVFILWSQCTFWCRVLTDPNDPERRALFV